MAPVRLLTAAEGARGYSIFEAKGLTEQIDSPFVF